MRRLGYVLAALAMAMSLTQGSAQAVKDIEWCAEDPVFHLLGTHFAVTTFVHSPASAVSQIAYTVDVPANAGKVHISYPGGKKIATTVEIRYSQPAYESDSFHVRVAVIVTGPDGREIRSELAGRSVTPATYTGWTNTAQDFEFDVTPR